MNLIGKFDFFGIVKVLLNLFKTFDGSVKKCLEQIWFIKDLQWISVYKKNIICKFNEKF